ncbi:oxidoreductase-like domain-containing protein [Duganella sp. HH105]|uniref:oxidoreductase-like domain-containing protein n=1 Tax=Duganella sp. HH105 TaxID=1781067 RepID=UPI0027D84429|nr:oxidoreductase-like domain-containing protein [Duganella sp. HH105]
MAMSDTAASIPADDPQPPQPGDCCHSGCTFCVEDMYQDELDRYRAALKAWRERHPGRG